MRLNLLAARSFANAASATCAPVESVQAFSVRLGKTACQIMAALLIEDSLRINWCLVHYGEQTSSPRCLFDYARFCSSEQKKI